MDETVWKVGALARRTGVSVRTLHYYEEIGLLRPSARTDSGHRLYVEADLLRLQQIRSLRQLGFSLEQARDALDGTGASPREIVSMHAERIAEHIAALERLRERLLALRDRLGEADSPDAETLVALIKEIDVVEKFEEYYSPEQLAYLEQHRNELGEERIRQAEQQWPRLIEQVRAEMARGTPPAHPRAQELARRWQALIDEFTGGDPGILQSLCNMYRQEPDVAAEKGYTPDPAMSSFISQALSASEGKSQE